MLSPGKRLTEIEVFFPKEPQQAMSIDQTARTTILAQPPLMNSSFFRNHGVWAFLIFAVVFQSLFVWGVSTGKIPSSAYAYRIFLPLFLVGLITWLGDGFSGLIELVRPMTVWKVSPGWYAFAVLWLIAFALGVIALLDAVEGHGLHPITLNFNDFEDFSLVRTQTNAEENSGLYDFVER